MRKIIYITFAIMLSSCATHKFVQHYENGKVSRKGQYRNQLLDGEIRSYFSNGQLWRIETYNKDVREGLNEYYYEDYEPASNGKFPPKGQLESRCYYKDGERNGLEETFYRNGVLASQSNYLNGKKTGTSREFYESGALKFEGTFEGDYGEGTWKYYYEDGKIWEIRQLKDGEYDCDRFIYLPDGRMQTRILFKDGEIVEYEVLTGKDESGSDLYEIHYAPSDEMAAPADEIAAPADNEEARLAQYRKDLQEALESGDMDRYEALKEEHEEDELDFIISVFAENERDGEFKQYYSTGELKMVTTRAKGEDNGPTTVYYKDGTIARYIDYKHNQPDGKIASYYKNGQVKFQGTMKLGKQDGRWDFYTESGVNTRTIIFRDGEIIKDIEYANVSPVESND